MPRSKTSFAANRKKRVLKQAKGYFGARSRLFTSAEEQLMKSGTYAYRDRRRRKRDFRKLWITRINAAVKEQGISYSKFMNGLKNAEVNLNRKVLSELAIHNPSEFNKIVDIAKKNIK